MARKQKKYHFIYKTTNKLNGKYYIGMHSTDNLDDGYLGSGKRLRYSIRKYGEENFEREILEFFDSREELKKREKEIVNLDEIAKINCMNLIVGGEGGRGFTSEEQKLNAKKSNDRQRWLKENDPDWVKKRSESQKKVVRLAVESGERDLFFFDWSGKKHSSKSKEKMSEAKKGKGLKEKNSQFGTCWITKESENKKIKKDELNDYIQQGWKKGRKTKK